MGWSKRVERRIERSPLTQIDHSQIAIGSSVSEPWHWLQTQFVCVMNKVLVVHASDQDWQVMKDFTSKEGFIFTAWC